VGDKKIVCDSGDKAGSIKVRAVANALEGLVPAANLFGQDVWVVRVAQVSNDGLVKALLEHHRQPLASAEIADADMPQSAPWEPDRSPVGHVQPLSLRVGVVGRLVVDLLGVVVEDGS